MSNGEVEVPFGEKPSETATLLLAAADELDEFDQGQVRTGSGVFIVPKKVADKAGVDYESEQDDEEPDEDDEPQKPAKKAAAKKSSSRR